MAPKKRKWKIETPQESAKYLNILIYGKPGSGKTHLAATASEVPEMQNVLFVDIESGSLTIRNSSLEVIRLHDFMEIQDIYEYLRAHCAARDSAEPEKNIGLVNKKYFPDSPDMEPKAYQTVIIDTLSELQRLNLYMIQNIDMNNLQLDDEWTPLEFKDWNKTTNMMRMVARAFRSLQMHTIFTSHESTDEATKYTSIAFPNALKTDLPAFVDIIGYLQTNNKRDSEGRVEVTRRLELEAGSKFLAKHRLGEALKGQSGILDPSMKKLFDIRQMVE